MGVFSILFSAWWWIDTGSFGSALVVLCLLMFFETVFWVFWSILTNMPPRLLVLLATAFGLGVWFGGDDD